MRTYTRVHTPGVSQEAEKAFKHSHKYRDKYLTSQLPQMEQNWLGKS